MGDPFSVAEPAAREVRRAILVAPIQGRLHAAEETVETEIVPNLQSAEADDPPRRRCAALAHHRTSSRPRTCAPKDGTAVIEGRDGATLANVRRPDKVIMTRLLQPGEVDDGAFDREFWRLAGTEAIFAAAAEMVSEIARFRGMNEP